MRKLMNILMLSCKKATELMEKELHFKLNRLEKIQLRMHTSMCNACSAYQKENKVMENALKTHIASVDKNENLSKAMLSDEFKKSLIKSLKDN